GRSRINFKLRDWLFSRQRYWGEPFPIVFDADGNHYGVSNDSLPVELPPLADYQPVESDEPTPLLGKATEWLKTTAGAAGVADLPPDTRVTRETNTMPGWAGSCWYYLRYCDPKNSDRLIGEQAERYWMGDNGVDLYIGGSEHAVLHLLYARFWHMALHDLGHIQSQEPFGKLFHQGLITSFAYKDATGRIIPVDEVVERDEKYYLKDGGEEVERIVAKMSKGLKNVVNPDDIIREYGADTFRLYEMYMGPLEASKPWNTKDTVGLFRFLRDIWRLCVDIDTGSLRIADNADDEVEKLLHKTIAKVGNDIERLAFNTAIAAMFEFKNTAQAAQKRQPNGCAMTRDQIERFTRILAPFVPHFAEELWHKLGNVGETSGTSVAQAQWPTFDDAMLVEAEIEIPVQINGKLIDKIRVSKDADEGVIKSAAMERDKVTARIGGGSIVKTIYVPGRMLNLIVK
ncbi:MAG: class I tRNA ligase family protein, partial [Phycisphaerales bacterium]|nr:class I tRNA ligase family protein [Phycisphaerales bacterium]